MRTTAKNTLMVLTIILLSAFFLSTGCEVLGEKGNGKVSREERKLSGFTGIDVGGAYDIFLTQGPVQSVIIEADENLLPLIRTEVINGTLTIDNERSISHPTALKIFITVPSLESVELSGAVDLQTQTKFTVPSLNINISGASDTKMELAVEKLRIRSSGGSDLQLTGTAGEVDMNVSGAVDVKAYDLQTNRFFIDMSGAGEANISVKDELRVDISGAATVRYRGNPAKVEKDISGAGSVRKAD